MVSFNFVTQLMRVINIFHPIKHSQWWWCIKASRVARSQVICNVWSFCCRNQRCSLPFSQKKNPQDYWFSLWLFLLPKLESYMPVPYVNITVIDYGGLPICHIVKELSLALFFTSLRESPFFLSFFFFLSYPSQTSLFFRMTPKPIS